MTRPPDTDHSDARDRAMDVALQRLLGRSDAGGPPDPLGGFLDLAARLGAFARDDR